MPSNPYDLWPDVPVMFVKCRNFEARLKHRIRRALEKCEDYGYSNPEQVGPMVFDKLRDLTEIHDALLQDM